MFVVTIAVNEQDKSFVIVFNTKLFNPSFINKAGAHKDNSLLSHLVGKKLLEHNDVEQFFVKNNLNTFNKPHIHRPRRRELFMPPALLIKEGLNNKLQLISGIKYDHKIFTSSFTAIVTTNISLLRIFNALLNSKLTSYIFLSTGSCIGIDRDRVHDEEKWEIPFSDNKQLSSIVEKIEKTAEEIYQRQPLSSSIGDLETTQKELIENLNKEIFKTFNLYEQELTLIDYATEITIPIIKKHRGYEEFFSSIDSESNILKNMPTIYSLCQISTSRCFWVKESSNRARKTFA